MRIQRGDMGQTPSLKNHKIKGFISILVRNPSTITKLLSQHSMLDHHRHASKTPFKWRFADGPIMARLYSGMWILSNLIKKSSKLDPLWQNFLDPRMIFYWQVQCSTYGRRFHCDPQKGSTKYIQKVILTSFRIPFVRCISLIDTEALCIITCTMKK